MTTHDDQHDHDLGLQHDVETLQRLGLGRRGLLADGEIPEETAGPYPGDGSNGPNVLGEGELGGRRSSRGRSW